MKTSALIIAVVCGVLVSAASAEVNIETVPVGDPGNASDNTGYGSMDYEYNIGKYEVTAGQYCEFLNAVAATDSYGLYNPLMDYDADAASKGCNIKRSGPPGEYTYSVAADWANRPVNHVSWGDAARFANWLHNGQPSGPQGLATTEDGAYFLNGATGNAVLLAVSREADWKWAIPTEDEWYKAAYHKNDGATNNYFDYPTGSDSRPSNNLIEPDGGNNANFAISVGIPGGGVFGVNYTIGLPYYRTGVGKFEYSESPYGTFDQGGNVYEWNEAILGSSRGMRGGSFDDYGNYLQASSRVSFDPQYGYHYLGFRVSEVPEPATLALLAMGGLAVMRGRRRPSR